MLKRTVFGALCAAALLVVATAAQAQDSATLTLKSGKQVTGQLVDLNASGFTVSVNGQNRQIPEDDVAVIDFSGGTMSTADWAKYNGSQQVVLRNGDRVDGQLYDISGKSPLKITVKTSNGDRDLSSDDISRIILARPSNAVATTGQAAGTFSVLANQQWTPTGITVTRGQILSFDTNGQIQLSANSDDVATSAGSTNQRYISGAPLPRSLAGALIGRIGSGQPFGIGNQTSVTMPATGQLYLGINDNSVGDNQGSFQVTIQKPGSTRP
ncbi:MAG TPA: hypothetical protein VFX12_07950 [Vicinamibacterales bacterium]|nr:hypothetical protein [Vicinamibacterales bacterium]